MFLFVFCFLSFLFASTNQGSPSRNWKQINVQKFQILYPEVIQLQAMQTAQELNHAAKQYSIEFGMESPKLSVALYPFTTQFNGMVSLAPFISEWYLSPSLMTQENFAITLANHEGYHMYQVANIRHGGQRIWSFVLGDIGRAQVLGIFFPLWYIEGDAVLAETRMSPRGRGRLASFLLPWKAKVLSNETPEYFSAYLGHPDLPISINNHYPLGYLLSSYGSFKHGPTFWQDVHKMPASNVYGPTFIGSLGDRARTSFNFFYEDAMLHYKKQWRLQNKNQKWNNITYSFPQVSDWNYQNNPFYYKGNTYTLEWGKTQTPTLKTTTKEIQEVPLSLIQQASQEYTRSLSYGGGKIAWLQNVPDIRFQQESRNDVYIQDLETNDKTLFLESTFILRTALSKNGKQIALWQANPSGSTQIQIYTIANKQKVDSLDLPFGTYVGDLEFSDKLTWVQLQNEKVSFEETTFPLQKSKSLYIANKAETLRTPLYWKHWILYQSDKEGRDAIYALNTQTNQHKRVVWRPLGAFSPALANSKLLFVDYQNNGTRIASIPLLEENFVTFTPKEKDFPTLAKIQSYYAYSPIEQIHMEEEEFHEELPHLRPHSLSSSHFPNILSFTSKAANFQTSLHFADPLNNWGLDLGHEYNRIEQQHGGFATLSYQRYFPILQTHLFTGGRSTPRTTSSPLEDTWYENSIASGLILPFNLSYGNNWSHTFSIGSQGAYFKSKTIESNTDRNGEGLYHSYSLQWNSSRNVLAWDLRPRQSFGLEAHWTRDLKSLTHKIHSKSIFTHIRIPSIFSHNHISWHNGFEHNKRNDDYLPTRSSLPNVRGTNWNKGNNKYFTSLNYAFPIQSLNSSLTRFFYANRIWANAFGDAALYEHWDSLTKGSFQQWSTGLEIFVQSHFLSNKALRISWGPVIGYKKDLSDERPQKYIGLAIDASL